MKVPKLKYSKGSEAKKEMLTSAEMMGIIERNHDKSARAVMKHIPLADGPPEGLVDFGIMMIDKYRKVKDQLERNRERKAVGSVIKKATEGADSLLSEARKDVVAARKPDLPAPKEVMEMAEAVADVKGSAEEMQMDSVQETMKDTTKLVNSLSFAQGGNKKMDKQFVIESLQEVADTPIVTSKESIAEFIADLHRTQIDEESRPLLAQKDFEKLTSFASPEPREARSEGGSMYDEDVEKYLKFQKEFEQSMDKAQDDKARERIQGRFQEIKDSFDQEVIIRAMMKEDQESELEGKYMGGILSQEVEESMETDMKLAEGGDVEDTAPVDTYDNIPPEEMEAVEASQLPDTEMENNYAEFVLNESLTEQDQEYLLSALEGDERLGGIFDKVMDVAGEFAGSGAVEGPGTGTSDSIPARLSDGEFVFTKKAVDQLGTDNLQVMMDDAERAFDGGLMKKYSGGSILTSDEMEDPDEDVHNQMLLANAMPSVRKK